MEFCRGLFGMPPAAPFLGRQEMEERTGQRGFPLCDSPTPGVKQYKIKRSTANSVCGLRATSSRVAAVDAHPVSFPRSGGASQGATVGGTCRSYPKRGRDYPIAAHEVKRRPQMICRALDGVKSLATWAGFQRAGPFGCSCILLAGQKYAPGGNKETSTNSVFL